MAITRPQVVLAGRRAVALITILTGIFISASGSLATALVPAGAVRREHHHPFGVVRHQLHLRGGSDAASQKELSKQDTVQENIATILEKMDAQKENADVQERACCFLYDLANNNIDNQRKIVAAGGVKRIMAAMDIHRGNADVQAATCFTARILAPNTERQGLSALQFVVSMGGSPARDREAVANGRSTNQEGHAHCRQTHR